LELEKLSAISKGISLLKSRRLYQINVQI